MNTTTLRSEINRADSDAYHAQREIEACVANIDRWLDRLREATTELREALDKLRKVQRLADEHGLDHEVPYPFTPGGEA
jgi:prefoldin subunit 5